MKNLAKFPKPGKRKRKVTRVTGPAESTLQSKFEAYLGCLGLRWLHIPDPVYRLCAPYSRTPIHVKKMLSDYLKGVPDLLVFKDDKVLILELKRKGGRLRQPQKAWLKGLTHHVVDDFETGKELIDDFAN